MMKIFQKVTGGLFDGYGIVPNEKKNKKIYFKAVSNTKNFNIKFCSMKLPMIKILPNLQGE